MVWPHPGSWDEPLWNPHGKLKKWLVGYRMSAPSATPWRTMMTMLTVMSCDGAGKPWHRGIVQQERWERLAKGGTAFCNSLQRVSLSVAALQGLFLQEKKKSREKRR